MKYCYDDLFYIINNYYWINEMIKQNEMLIEQSKNNAFLMNLNKQKIYEVNELKDKVNYIDESVELINDDKVYWIILLLMEGSTKSKIKKIMRISHTTLMKKVDKGIETILNHVRENEMIK